MRQSFSKYVAPIKRWASEIPEDESKQTKWERGKAHAVAWQSGDGFSYLYTVVPTVLTVLVVQAEWWERLVAGFVVGTIAWLVVPYGWAALVAVFAARPQRNDARKALADCRDQIRSANLSRYADGLVRWARQQRSENSPKARQSLPDKGFPDDDRVAQLRNELDGFRGALVEMGQPELADEIPRPTIDLVGNIEAFREELERYEPLFLQWREGQGDLPPFAPDASDEGLRLPPLDPLPPDPNLQ